MEEKTEKTTSDSEVVVDCQVSKRGYCKWCEEEKGNIVNVEGHKLCKDCAEVYDNKTGYCSLWCCMTGECDESC